MAPCHLMQNRNLQNQSKPISSALEIVNYCLNDLNLGAENCQNERISMFDSKKDNLNTFKQNTKFEGLSYVKRRGKNVMLQDINLGDVMKQIIAEEMKLIKMETIKKKSPAL